MRWPCGCGGSGTGCPFSYNVDEDGHFVPVAIGFFGHGLDPRYFLNPPGYTELLYVVYAVWFGGPRRGSARLRDNPSEVFLIARVTVALLGTVAVWLLHLAGARLFDRRVGLLAAALGAVAFLPVFYCHLALNDVPATAPATLALLGAALVLRGGGRARGAARRARRGPRGRHEVHGRDRAAAAADGDPRDRARPPRAAAAALVVPAAAACAAALGGFLVANPYALLDFERLPRRRRQQRRLASGEELAKLGLTQRNGVVYYLWSLTWGLGWIPALAALGGAIRLLVRDRRLALVLLPAPLLYVVFMGLQERYFGRWLLPVLPIASLLAAYGGMALARAVAARAPRLALPAAALVALAAARRRGCVTAVHVDRVLARPDTRGSARAWLLANVPAGERVVIEPFVPARWLEDPDRAHPATPGGGRWRCGTPPAPTSTTPADRCRPAAPAS